MNPINDQQLDAIEQRANAATPGPWSTHENWPGRVFSDASGHVARCTGSRGEADAEFAAHARQDVEQLVSEVRRLRATPPMECINCETPVGWVDCPTGGWWAHETHPADGHDAAPRPAVRPAVETGA